MLFDTFDFYKNEPDNNYDFALDIMTGNFDRPKLYDASEGLEKGNMFPSLYEGYKQYKEYKLKPRSERQKQLLEIQKMDFAISDLNLYLDLHPDDLYAFKTFKMYVTECKKKKDEYAKNYGPLCLDETYGDKYEWDKGVWPWEEGEM